MQGYVKAYSGFLSLSNHLDLEETLGGELYDWVQQPRRVSYVEFWSSDALLYPRAFFFFYDHGVSTKATDTIHFNEKDFHLQTTLRLSSSEYIHRIVETRCKEPLGNDDLEANHLLEKGRFA